MPRRLSFSLALVSCLLASVAAYAQEDQSSSLSAPAHIAVVEGSAVLERNGVAEPAAENVPLLQGDRLKTETGRLEIVLPDGSIVDLDRQTTVDLLAGGLVRLMGGRIIFIVAATQGGEAPREYQVDAPAGAVRLGAGGEYRVFMQASAGRPFLEVSVVRGRATVEAEGRSAVLQPGQRVQVAQGEGITAIGTFNSALADAFVEWAEGLRGDRVGTQSNAYLPPELQVYGGTFDRDGSWDNAGEYGWVWYPRVAADWRPYYYGGWYPYGWGWTWVGGGPWTWPTHHYGRWGYGTRGWFWIPSAAWGPAWVSWGFSSGYVSWCPLGYYNAPVFGFSFGISFGGYSNHWRGWTVVPHHAFGHGYRVPSYALHGEHLRAVERTAFDVRKTGPALPGGPAAGRYDGGRVAPYDRARAVAAPRAASNAGWGTTTPGGSIAQRRGSAGIPTAYQGAPAAGGRQRPPQAGVPERTASYDTTAFRSSSSSPLPPYPNGARTAAGAPSRPSLGSAVPRSAPLRPSESRSPYYYLGPSQPRSSAAPPSSATPRAAVPGAPAQSPPSRGGRSYSSDASTWRSPAGTPAPGGWAAPRSYRNDMPYSAPSAAERYAPRSYSVPGRSYSVPDRSYSVPDRQAQPRPAPSWSGPSGGWAGRPSGSAPSGPGPSAPPAAGVSGGRTPGRATAGPSGGGPSGGAPSGGGRTSGGGGRAAGGGGGGRGGRGR